MPIDLTPGAVAGDGTYGTLTEAAFGKFKILESTVLDCGYQRSADADAELARWHDAR